MNSKSQFTINTVYVSNNGYARVQSQLDALNKKMYYAVQTYDTATREYTHYQTFTNQRTAIDIAENVSNT